MKIDTDEKYLNHLRELLRTSLFNDNIVYWDHPSMHRCEHVFPNNGFLKSYCTKCDAVGHWNSDTFVFECAE